MTKETTKSLRQMLVSLDATYRVHTRLYKVNHALYSTTVSNLRATKNNSVGITGTAIAALFTIVAVAIQVLGVNPSSVPILLIYAFIVFVFYLGYLSYTEASKAQKEFEDIIGKYQDKNVFDGIETWIDFTQDEISKLSTRISIIKQILGDEELEPETKIMYKDQLDFNAKKLIKFNTLNEELYSRGARKKEDYDAIKKYVEAALKMVE